MEPAREPEFLAVPVFKRRCEVNVKGIDTVDGRNPAPVDVVDIPVFICIHRVLYIPGGAGFFSSTVSTNFSPYQYIYVL